MFCFFLHPPIGNEFLTLIGRYWQQPQQSFLPWENKLYKLIKKSTSLNVFPKYDDFQRTTKNMLIGQK